VHGELLVGVGGSRARRRGISGGPAGGARR
jgi:hypothetical protein